MPDTSNPYDALLQQNTANNVRVSMMDAVSKAPDAEARLQALARDYSMPVDAVRLRLPEMEQRAKLDAVDYDSLAQRYPKASNMLADPQQAAVAHDDVDNLTTLEKVGGDLVGTAKYLFSAPGAKNTLMGDIGAGIYGASEGYSGVARAALEAAATPLDAFMRPTDNPLRQAADYFAADARVADAKAKALSPAQSGIVGGGVSSGVQSLTQNLLTLPMALLPGGEVPALLTMSGTQGGQSYQEAREAGVGQWQALAHGTSQAVIEYATEKLPLHKLIGDVKEGTPLLKSIMHNAALEVPGEQIATALQDMNDWATLHPEKPFSDYLAERPGAAAQTLIATLIGVGGNVTLAHAMQSAVDNATGTVRTAQQAEAHAQVLNTLVKVAESSKLRERDPAQFNTFMQSVVEDGAPNLFVDARTLATMPQLHEIAMALPSVAEQIADAAQTGGDVAIPTAELLTAGPGHEFMQGLLDHARTDPEAMSPVQAREYMQSHGDQLKADIDKVLAEKEGDQTWQQMRDQVRDEFKAQLDQAKRFTSGVNAQYAGLLANFYSVTAAKLGMAPQELVQRYGLQVRGDALPGGRALDQGTTPDVWGTLTAAEDAGGRSAVLAAARTLSEQHPAIAGEVLRTARDLGYDLRGEGGQDLALVEGSDGTSVDLNVKAGSLDKRQGASVDVAPADRTDGAATGRQRVGVDAPVTSRVDRQSPAIGVVAHDGVSPRLPEARRSAEADAAMLAGLPPMDVDTIERPGAIIELHGVRDVGKFRALAARMEKTGKWLGRPLLVYRDASGTIFALTGSHRLAAAKRAGIPVPVVYVDGQTTEFENEVGDYLPDVAGSGDDRVLDFLKQAGDEQAAALMQEEIDENDKGFTLNQKARGSINLPEDLTNAPAVISLFKGADLSTFVHEAGHFFLEVQMDLAARIQAQINEGATVSDRKRAIVDDARTILTWLGVKGSETTSALGEWHGLGLEAKRPMHEQWARGFEAYAFEGNAPSLELGGMFQKFRAWLLAVYKELKALNVTLTDDVRGVMDRMLASAEAIQQAEAARRMGPLFKTAEEAGMTLDEFKAYHALATDASQAAIEDLQARGLRDMRWLSGAKDRKLRELQKLHDTLRREVRAQVRAEVMAQPVYRAWSFLTGKPEPISGEVQPELQTYRQALAKWTNDRTLTELDAREAEKAALLSAHPDAVGIERGQVLAKNKRQIDINVAQAMLEWEQENPKPKRPDVVEPAGPDHAMFGKADFAAVASISGKDVAEKLKARKMTSQSAGIHPDNVAELVGFSSGDEMVKALAEAEPPKSVIEGMTDQRMLEQHGDLGTPEGLQRAVDRAIHNEARARFVASEIKALERGAQVRQATGRTDRNGRPVTVDLLAQVARGQAQRIVAGTKVRNLQPSRYTNAEARAAKAAEKAMLAGNTAEALAEKRHQLINLQAAKATMAAQDEVDKAVRYLRKFADKPKGLDAEYYDQIAGLLNRHDLASIPLRAVDKRKSLLAWAESQREQGMEPDIPPELLDEARRQSFKDMTVEELRGLRDTVRQIERLGRVKNTLLTAKQLRDFQAVRDLIADSIDANNQGRKADTRTPAAGTFAAWFAKVKNFGAAHIKAATWARIFDGGKDGGPVWEYFIRPANDAADMENRMRAEATEKLAAILEPVIKAGRMDGKGRMFPSIGRSMNREQVLAVALNMGNEGNLQRMLDGEGWAIEQVLPVVRTLSGQDMLAVQAVWDHFESYRPLIAAKERRIYGKEPDWVQPMPITLKTADGQDVSLRGGYYPVKYDPLANNRAEQHADAEDAKRQMQAAYTSATTRRGFTKSRAEAVKGRPLLYSLAAVYSGVNDVIHDLAFHEWLIDVNKLLRSDKINGAIREAYGPAVVKQLKTWVEDTARGEQGLQAELDSALGRLRQGVSAAGLSFNVVSAVMQPLGLTQSIVQVGAPWIGRGLAQYIASPVGKTREVNAMSEFMAGRARTRFRELNEIRNQVEGQSKGRELLGRYGYWLMMRCQQMVDVPTWLGAYEKAMAEGNADERARSLADQAVIDAQGGGETKDLSAIERGGPAQKMFTVFYSFMNTALNIGVGKAMTEKSRGKLAADMLMLYTVPAVLGAILKDAITPGDSGDWDEWGKALKRILGEEVSYLFGLMVVAREFGEAAKSSLGLVDHARDYSGPSGVRLVADTYGLAKQASQGEFDDAMRKQAVNVMGDLFGLPSAQVNRTINGAQAINEGKTVNPAALVTGYQEPH